jgi:SAM-dependent methyltransferase
VNLKQAVKSLLRRTLGLDIVRVPRQPGGGSFVSGAPAEWRRGEGQGQLPVGLRQVSYKTYEEYARHQAAKLATLELSTYDVRFRSALTERLAGLNLLRRGDSVLCLAARVGSECKAFIDLGCFAVGVDLNPGEGNRYVVHGDFHDLQYADASVDYVYTNSLDHAFDIDRIVREVVRVLKPGGAFIAEIVGGSQDDFGREPGAYESLWWDRVDNLVDHIARHGFVAERRQRFAVPWAGDQVVFRRIVEGVTVLERDDAPASSAAVGFPGSASA